MRKIVFFAAFVIPTLLVVGCSGDEAGPTDTGSTDFPDRTLAANPPATSTTESTTQPEGATIKASEVLLRLEGKSGTSFSGVCTTGAEDSVLLGKIPKTYRFDLRGESLSCEIKKQSSGNGSLRAVLLAGDNTRSIQQTKSQNSILNIAYSGG